MEQQIRLELISEEHLDFPDGTTCIYQIVDIPMDEQKDMITSRVKIPMELIEYVKFFAFHGTDGMKDTDLWLCTGGHELDFIGQCDKCDNTKNISWITQEVNRWLTEIA